MAEVENTNVNENVEEKVAEEAPQLIKSDVYHQYYVSDSKFPFEPVEAHFTFAGETYYPFVKTAPDASIKSPKYDWGAHAWIENDANEVGQQIVKVSDKINGLTDTVATLQNDHAQTVKNDELTKQEIKSIQQMVASSNAMMGQFSGQMAQFGTAINKLAEVINAKPAENVQKDNSENTNVSTPEGTQASEPAVKPAESNAAQEQPQA